MCRAFVSEETLVAQAVCAFELCEELAVGFDGGELSVDVDLKGT